jgi:hypothetical protein
VQALLHDDSFKSRSAAVAAARSAQLTVCAQSVWRQSGEHQRQFDQRCKQFLSQTTRALCGCHGNVFKTEFVEYLTKSPERSLRRELRDLLRQCHRERQAGAAGEEMQKEW